MVATVEITFALSYYTIERGKIQEKGPYVLWDCKIAMIYYLSLNTVKIQKLFHFFIFWGIEHLFFRPMFTKFS